MGLAGKGRSTGSEGAGRSTRRSRTEPAGARNKDGKERTDADRWGRTGSATEGEHASGVERRQGGPRLSASAGESTAGSGEVSAALQVRLTGAPRWVTRTTRDAGLRVMLG